jgi:hypothetical protein
MDLKAMSKKLRHAADVIDELFEGPGTPAIAKKILRNGKKHWTQTPEGKKKLLLRSKKAKEKA